MPADTMSPPEADDKRPPRKGGKPKAPKPADTRPKSPPVPPDWEAAFAQTVDEIKSVADTALRFTQDPTYLLPDKVRRSRQLLSDIYIKIDDFRSSDAFHIANVTSKNSIDSIEKLCNYIEQLKKFLEGFLLTDYDDRPIFPATARAVGEAFARAREKKGISKSQLHRDTGMARANLAKFESGTHSPTLDSVQKYADALGLEAHIVLKPKDIS